MQHIIPDFVTESVHCSTIVENDRYRWYSICVSHQHISKLACNGCIIILSSGHNKPVCPWKSVLQSYYIVLLHSKLQFAFSRKRTIVWFFSLLSAVMFAPLSQVCVLRLQGCKPSVLCCFLSLATPSRIPPPPLRWSGTPSPPWRNALHCTQVYV